MPIAEELLGVRQVGAGRQQDLHGEDLVGREGSQTARAGHQRRDGRSRRSGGLPMAAAGTGRRGTCQRTEQRYLATDGSRPATARLPGWTAVMLASPHRGGTSGSFAGSVVAV